MVKLSGHLWGKSVDYKIVIILRREERLRVDFSKRIISAGIVAAALTFFLVAPADTFVSDQDPADSILPEGCQGQMTDDQVIVYYFTRKFHCQSCETVERILLGTVRERYAKPFSEGRLAMCVVNVDDPVNRHYLNEYPIISNSIFLVRKVNGEVLQSKNLEDVWGIAQDPDAITRFLEENLDGYIAEADWPGTGDHGKAGPSRGNKSDEGENVENRHLKPANRNSNFTDR